MKKKILITSIAIIAATGIAFPQYTPKSLGSIEMSMNQCDWEFNSHIRVQEDSIFVKLDDGIYARPIYTDSEWKLYAFKNLPISNYWKHENNIIGYNSYIKENRQGFYTDFYLSEDYGQSHLKFQPIVEGTNLSANTCFWVYSLYSPYTKPDRLIMRGADAFQPTNFYMSEDFGKSWRKLNSDIYQNIFIYFCDNDATVYAIVGYDDSGKNICISTTYDDGATWTKNSIGSGDILIPAFMFNPYDKKEIWVAVDKIKAHTTDGGKTWDLDWDGVINGVEGLDAEGVQDWRNPNRRYNVHSSCDEEKGECERSLSYSEDNGKNWITVYTEKTGEYIPDFSYQKIWMLENSILALSRYDRQFWLFDLDSINKIIASKEEIALDGEGWNYTNGILAFAGANGGIQVYDIAGRCVATTAEGTLDMANISKGVYIAIAADSDGRTSSFRFIHR